MSLELLPNEILLNLFDYFDGVDLFYAFYDLNSRFNLLIYQQLRLYSFNFESISKRSFDMICQQHLPFIADRVISLSLSNYRDTPKQINLFLSYVSSFNQFTHLKSLTICYIRSYDLLMKIINQCHHLSNLIRLNLYCPFFRNQPADFQLIVNKVWSLIKLIHCSFAIAMQIQKSFCIPNVVSQSIQSLSILPIYGCHVTLNQINSLFRHTLHLKRLSIQIDFSIYADHILSPLPTLTDLKITIVNLSNVSIMASFLKNMPNLHRLYVNLLLNIIDGYQWEEIIYNYLPNLQLFRLKMNKPDYFHQFLDKLVDSFRSPFWIDEHQWFVRCFIWNETIYLCTLSNIDSYFKNKLANSWRSTYPYDDEQTFYNSILTKIYNDSFFDQSISHHIRLSNIQNLHIKFPINNKFWSIVSSLKRLNSLKVSSYTNSFQSHLQALLDQAPRLYKLTICQNSLLPLQISLFECKNLSIRNLDLGSYNHHFNEEECITLSHSSIGTQCKILFIQVENPDSIFCLVKNMTNLQTLYIHCRNSEHCAYLPLTNNNDEYYEAKIPHRDGIIQWLKCRLPSTYVIVRDLGTDDRIIIWI